MLAPDPTPVARNSPERGEPDPVPRPAPVDHLPWTDAVRAHSRAAYPDEACGLLFRSAETTSHDRGAILAVACTNASGPERSRRFVIDPSELHRHLAAGAAIGSCLVGLYHSHPEGVPIPSRTDRAEAVPGLLYAIVALGRAAPSEVALFRTGAAGAGELVPVGLRARPVGSHRRPAGSGAFGSARWPG